MRATWLAALPRRIDRQRAIPVARVDDFVIPCAALLLERRLQAALFLQADRSLPLMKVCTSRPADNGSNFKQLAVSTSTMLLPLC